MHGPQAPHVLAGVVDLRACGIDAVETSSKVESANGVMSVHDLLPEWCRVLCIGCDEPSAGSPCPCAVLPGAAARDGPPGQRSPPASTRPVVVSARVSGIVTV